MKSVALLSAMAAAAHAGPTKTVPVAPRQVSLEPITATGNAFFRGSERFYVRGIDYQPGGSAGNVDPLADPRVCMPDIERFIRLGINTIRVYSTDNSLNHDECMNALAEAGIYVVLDANNPNYSINRADPHPSYNAVYLQSVFATIDAFANYPNTMAFFSGNEVIHDHRNTTLAARYVKATDRDMRAYIRARGYRRILVGYSAADVTENRMQTAAYFNCGSEEERSDFFAFNDYSWCSSDFLTAGWDIKVRNFTGYGIPIFLSEYGCNHNTRNFGEIESLMHSNMTSVYSGGLMYEYSMEPNRFGIVEIEGGQENGFRDQTGERRELDEFDAFASALERWPAPTGDGGYTSTTNAASCPTADEHWMIDTTSLPAIPEGALRYFDEGAGEGPGLNGPGSQWAGDQASTGDGGTGGSGSAGSNGNNQGGDENSAMRGAMPTIVSGLVVLLTLTAAVAL
ncbi:1,3-beta-glucanosyltransferase [Madurella fahalii]|uniref:1,3-beta-glucanosyltransferase n=1 Tax=Madurella fahalii TaxID=1157608 RepID=A0ABQ0GNA9_9PEZI